MSIFRFIKPSLCFLIPFLLSACATPFQPENYHGPMAKLDVSTASDTLICIGDHWESLVSDKQGLVDIPAGQRFTFKINYQSGTSGNVYYFCNPSISFMPRQGRRYLLNIEMVHLRCLVTVARLDPQARVGLSKEPIYTGGRCGSYD